VARGSKVRIELAYGRLPVHPYVLDMYRRGETTGSNKANRAMAEGWWENRRQLKREEEELLFDPQTSGGLLLAVPASRAGELVQKLKEAGVQDAVVIGQVIASDHPGIDLV
jgi:selenide,water dikinase